MQIHSVILELLQGQTDTQGKGNRFIFANFNCKHTKKLEKFAVLQQDVHVTF